jgi:hypothetical protein
MIKSLTKLTYCGNSSSQQADLSDSDLELDKEVWRLFNWLMEDPYLRDEDDSGDFLIG